MFESYPVKRKYRKFMIGWSSKPRAAQEREIVSKLEFFLPKLQKYSRLMRKDAKDNVLIAVLFYHSRDDPLKYTYDFWYDHTADLFGLRILDNHRPIAEVRFPKDIVL
jgi:hypothetical protein